MFRRRGRLIFPVHVDIAQLDTKATRDAGAYDDLLRETVLEPTSDGVGSESRKEKGTVRLPCQVEERDYFERLDMYFAGNAPSTILHLTFHLADLERLGKLDNEATQGVRPGLKVNDRIVAFVDRWGQPMYSIPNPPGLYVREVRPTGFLETQNLAVVIIGERKQAAV
jgi:hypothetical protein